jgi:flagellum-specific ATP synthase
VSLPDPPLGLVIDALGRPLNTDVYSTNKRLQIKIRNSPPGPLERSPINSQLTTGVKIVDSFCPIGYGQRMAISASAGVGKSTLIGMITRNARVDATVIALVGERGREVGEFIDECLGPEGLARSILVVATSDESAGRRWMAPQLATAIAENLRDSGLNVLLVIDSLTRSARAIRDLGLSAGELPVRQGYTAAVYTQLPKLLERAGKTKTGSITGLYTLLSSSENEHDALSEEVRSLLDGHLILDSGMARSGIRPAIDPLQSLSRLAGRFIEPTLQVDIECILSAFKRLRNDRDIVLLGGTPDPELRAALELESQITSAISQGTRDCIDSAISYNIIRALAETLRSRCSAIARGAEA